MQWNPNKRSAERLGRCVPVITGFFPIHFTIIALKNIVLVMLGSSLCRGS